MSDSRLICSNCGASIPPGSRFCERCGTPVAAPASTYASRDMQVLTGFESAPQMPTYAGSDPLLEFEVDYPETLSRWKIFVKWLLAIPHFIVLYIFGIVAGIAVIIAWFAILITGKYPRGLWDFMLLYLRWSANVYAYSVTLQRDEYPPFGDAAYPVHLNLEYPQSLSRWLIFVKWLLVIPHLIVLYLLLIAASVAIFIAWFAILITGSYPRGLFDFVTGVGQWLLRVSAYIYLMTDRYPPFSLD